MRFTLFVILPNTNEVCTLRHVKHGSTIREVRSRLEVEAGLPAQIYRLHNSDGQYMHEEHCLLLEQNVWDGFVLRTQLFESWTELYRNVVTDAKKEVIQNGAVKATDNIAKTETERRQVEAVIEERGSVALYVAAFHGLYGMCGSLLQVGVNPNGRTPFGRTPLHVAASRDNDAILDLLVQFKCNIDSKDYNGETALHFARKVSARVCSRKLRLYSLDQNGIKPLNGRNRKAVKVTVPSDQTKQRVKGPPSALKRQSFKTLGVTSQDGQVRGSTSATICEDPSVRSETQCYVWDIQESNQKKNVSPPIRVQTAVPATRKTGVRWNDTPSLIEVRKPPQVQRGASAVRVPQTILKKRQETDNIEKRNNLIKTLSQESLSSNSSTVKSEIAPSQPDSDLTLVSAPGNGSRPGSFDVRSVESAPVASSYSKKTKGSVRLLPFRRKQNEPPASAAKRQIRLAEKHKHKYTPKENAETFDDWLERKRLQECRERLSSRSGDSSRDSDSDTTDGNSRAYDDWMRNRGRRKLNNQREMTVEELYRWNDRPLRGVVMIGQSHVEHPVAAEEPDRNLRAYQNWKERKPKAKHTPLDQTTLKIRLEQKRQQLLAAAITYDDWLEHAEEKKLLMKQILKANMKELERLEEENNQKRTPRQISWEKWTQDVEKREMAERRKADESRQLEESMRGEKLRSSACVTHDSWLSQKRAALKAKQRSEYTTRTRANQKEADVGNNGRELLRILREKRRGVPVANC